MRELFAIFPAKLIAGVLRPLGLAVLLIFLPVSSQFCLGQAITGTVTGTAVDPSGAVIPNAQVALRNVETNLTQAVVTNGSGDYVVTSVNPGIYVLTGSAEGFKNVIVNQLVLDAAQTIRQNLKFYPGALSESVTVTNEISLVQPDTSSLGSVVTAKQINDLPQNGRQGLANLIALTPGAQGSTQLAGNASQFGGTNISYDGMIANDVANARVINNQGPSLEGIGEVKITTSGGAAEYGRGGSQIIVQSKFGTNQFHGSLFYFNRNRDFAARDYFNRAPAVKPTFNRNEFGGSIGGPILKNKLFAFFSFESLHVIAPSTFTETMPSTAMVNGDFSAFPATIIYDPVTKAPFPGNIIPTSRIANASKVLAGYYPAPTQAGTGTFGLANDFSFSFHSLEINPRYAIRGDWTLSPNDRIFVRFYHNNDGPYLTPFGSTTTPLFGNYDISTLTRNISVGYTKVFNSAVTNDFRTGFNYEADQRNTQNANFQPSSIIPGSPIDPQGGGGLPTVNINGFQQIFDQSGALHPSQHVFQLSDDFTRVAGNHTFKTGFQFLHTYAFNGTINRGSFSFTGTYTSNFATSPSNLNAFADFLLGDLHSSSSSTQAYTEGLQTDYYAGYAQDDWRATKHLTLNYGLRYEYNTLPNPSSGTLANFYPNLNGGTLVAIKGTPSVPSSSTYPYVLGSSIGIDTGNYAHEPTKNFAPRFGFAFRPFDSKNIVIRSAFGIFFDPQQIYLYTVFGNNPPYILSKSYTANNSGPPTLTWDTALTGTASLPTGVGINAVTPNLRAPYAEQWNLTVEDEFIRNTALRITYLGKNGKEFPYQAGGGFGLNTPPQAPGQVQAARPYQPWGAIPYQQFNNYDSFNQLQAGLIRRAHNLYVDFEYSFTRALGIDPNTSAATDPQDIRYDYGNISGVAKHYAFINYSYTLPFGEGQRFHTSFRPINTVIGGWRFAGIETMRTGNPFSVSFTSSLTGFSSGRATVVQGVPLYPSHQSLNQWFNPAAFTNPALYTYGLQARNTLIGPAYSEWDAGFIKQTTIHDRLVLELRAECFNVLNRTNFSNPNANITNSNVGTISGDNAPRQFQFAGRLSF